MAVLHVRNIPDDLYRHAQAIAEARGSTLSSLVIDLMNEATTRDNDHKRHTKAVLRIRRNLTRRHRGSISSAELLRSVREDRERERA